jgi:hypothetical protein
MATALIFVSCFFIGWNESVCLSLSGIELLDQREIGTAVGGKHILMIKITHPKLQPAAGSIRSTISSIASAVYISILTNRLSETIPSEVPPALIEAGLPASSVPAFLNGLTTGSFANVPGLDDNILAIGTRAYRFANAHAYRTVFFTTIAFTSIAVILSFFAPNVDNKMTGQVAVTLHRGGKREVVEDNVASDGSAV